MCDTDHYKEQQIDGAIAAIRDKMAVKTNYGDSEVQAAALVKTFKFFDTDHTGYVDYAEFVSAMTSMNFVGVQGTLESIFDAFGETADSGLMYSEFAKAVFGLNPSPSAQGQPR
jgi:Ca2+-binding EF-hand superfamily protein